MGFGIAMYLLVVSMLAFSVGVRGEFQRMRPKRRVWSERERVMLARVLR